MEMIAASATKRIADWGDDRISCGECRQGKSQVCKDVLPKPWDVLNRCHVFEAGPFDADRDLPVVRKSYAKVIHARDF